MNYKSLITAGLLAAGLISSASAATGDGVIVTLTGSTAFRAVVFTACTTPDRVFNSTTSNTNVLANPIALNGAGNGANDIVYEGYITNNDGTATKYDLVCSFTGSEAGIAAASQVASIANPTPVFNGGTSPLPGVPPKYLTQASGYTVKGDGTTTLPSFTDLALSDTSQAVSLTKRIVNTATDLKDYGIAGIVPFMWMKGKNSAPTNSWPHLVNVTHPAAFVCIQSGAMPPRLFTGNAADPDTESIVIVGRNIGSGTHANQMLDLALKPVTPVDQFAINSSYAAGGVLTQNGVITYADTDVLEVGPDGFDGGGSVSACLRCDGKFSTTIAIGMLGISDAIGLPIHTGGAEAGGAVILTVDGVTESNGAIENGQYTVWGHEHLLGKHGQLTTQPGGIVGGKLFAGLPATLVANAWGTVAATQDVAIPVSLMRIDKSGGDSGYPAP
jgi:hypothetical protein